MPARSTLLSEARKMVNDNDATNPFHTDAQIHGFLDEWQWDLAAFLLYPRAQQTIAFAVNEGGDGSTKNLNTDMLLILRVMLEPASGSDYTRLKPSNELEIGDKFPDWRNFASGSAAYYVIGDTITDPGSSAGFPRRTITTERPLSVAKTMRVHYVQMLATSTSGTVTPIFPVPLHITGVYYACYRMMMPRNMQKAVEYYDLYKKERARLRDVCMRESQENMAAVWDLVETGGSGDGSLTR